LEILAQLEVRCVNLWQSVGVRTLLVSHPGFLLHTHTEWHPERPERLDATIQGVRESQADIVEVEATRVDRDLLRTVHPRDYVAAIERFCSSGGGNLDPDTYASADSWDAAIRAAGAGPQAVEALRSGSADNAFLAVRPPGHHALANQAMGFCLFNNIAVTAQMLIDGGEKVAIVDWDIHHGNGTQDLFISNPDALYLSVHQYPFYPGTGWLDETGYGPGSGMTVNVPVPPRSGGDVYRATFDQMFSPILRQFSPDWLLVSCGFDAHMDDPLADGQLVSGDYAYMAGALARDMPPSRTIFFLEGGYNLSAIQSAATATIDGAFGKVPEYASRKSGTKSWRALDSVKASAGVFWTLD